jgi:hypothetical protein
MARDHRLRIEDISVSDIVNQDEKEVSNIIFDWLDSENTLRINTRKGIAYLGVDEVIDLFNFLALVRKDAGI